MVNEVLTIGNDMKFMNRSSIATNTFKRGTPLELP